MKQTSHALREIGGTLFYLVAAAFLTLAGFGFIMLFSGKRVWDTTGYVIVVVCFLCAVVCLARALIQRAGKQS